MSRSRALRFLALSLLTLLGAGQAAATVRPGTYLILPVYQVEPGDPLGRTTLWAVRNASSSSVDLRVQYFAATMATEPEAEETFDLAPNQTKTRNLRDALALGIPTFGWARFIAFQNGSTVHLQPNAIHGDYFLVEPGDAFAGGSELLRDHRSELAVGVPTPPQHDLCQIVETRFFNGGSFTGGSDFVVHAQWDPAAGYTNPLVVGKMYDEAGHFLGNCNVNAPPSGVGHFAYTSITNTTIFEVVCPALPTFGTIEWTFATGVKGLVTVWHKASGLYAAMVAGACTKH